MKIKLTLIALSIIILSSCKKDKPDFNPEIVPPPEIINYSKMESFFTPYENKQPVTSRKFLFSSKSYDQNGNLSLYLYRVFGHYMVDTTTNTLEKITYKYENNKLVENYQLSIAKAIFPVDDQVKFTYTNKGDTAEINRYDNKTGKPSSRYVYSYGSNGMKSRITRYSVSAEGDNIPGTEYYSEFFKYDNNKNIIESSYIVPDTKVPVNYTIKYSYNSKKHLIKAINITFDIKPYYEGQYSYDEKGRIAEYTKTENRYGYPNPFPSTISRFVNSYTTDDHLSKQAIYINDVQTGIIEYTYIK